mmetsp:Transcript_4265/g.6510  ORF Transcript_4265/g.6510 Transcript_4265/m.6510 type:complete len:108 (-) Transcript_4265:260-583(-)
MTTLSLLPVASLSFWGTLLLFIIVRVKTIFLCDAGNCRGESLSKEGGKQCGIVHKPAHPISNLKKVPLENAEVILEQYFEKCIEMIAFGMKATLIRYRDEYFNEMMD